MSNKIKDIDIIILCGGLGKRLESKVRNKQKVLATIKEKAFIDILINNILLYGFKNIILCVGHLKDQVKDHFKNINYQNCNIIFSDEDEPLGTGGALKNAKCLIKTDHFMVMNGDSICNINFRNFFDFHIRQGSLLSMVLVASDNIKDYGSVKLNDSGKITYFNEKNLINNDLINKDNLIINKDNNLVSAGIYLMRKDIFYYMPEHNSFSLEYNLFPKIINKKCYGFIANSKLIDIGTPERYETALEGLGDILIIETNTIKNLEIKAKRIRRYVVSMIHSAGSGHPGGSLSCVDILTTLYFYFMKHNPSDIKWDDRDRFILSKGHAAPALYAILAESGYFSVSQLSSLRKIDSKLQGHIDSKIPGIEISTGSLGQGLSIASGIAYRGKLDKKNFRVYTLLGDGECDEGQIWEAAMFASHYKLDNLVAIIDRNYFQIDGLTEDIMSLEPFVSKWKAFGWNVIEIDGNKILEIIIALNDATMIKNKPTVIIAKTIKGKGVPFLEGNNEFHGKALNKEEMEIALQELD